MEKVDSRMRRRDVVGLVGTGVMARGIARLALDSGKRVRVWARSAESADRIATYLREKCSAHIDEPENLECGIVPQVLAGADIVIESVVEDLALKRRSLAQLADVLDPATVIGSNTSSLRVRDIMAGLKVPERCLGLHFMNPPHRMPLVEVVPTDETSETNVKAAVHFCRELGKEPVVVPDEGGFILNRLLFPMICEAIAIYDLEEASAGDIDRIVKLGARHPMGPLELADFIGLDVCAAILRNLQGEMPSTAETSIAVLEELVGDGRCGRKTRHGFYEYGE